MSFRRIRISLSFAALLSLFAVADNLPAQSSPTEGDIESPADVAAAIEQAMTRFDRVEFRASFLETRDVNAFHPGREPLLVTGSGTYFFRGDKPRWRVFEKTFTVALGKRGARPVEYVAGYDGKLHHHRRHSVVYLGEESNGRAHWPAKVFWDSAKNWSWLKAALTDSNARIVEKVDRGGFECLRIVSEFESGRSKWKYDVVISPQQSWLPLSTRIFLNGELDAEEHIDQLKQSGTGVWYPSVIRFENQRPFPVVKKRTVISELTVTPRFNEQDFAPELPLDADIVDYRRGVGWRNDPWWLDMQDWLRAEINWPRRDLAALEGLTSFADAKREGQPAPELTVSEWLVPNPRLQETPTLTLLFFFGGRAISPTPKWMAAVTELRERYRRHGLHVIGIASASRTPDLTRAAVSELQVAFPVAIDQDSENGYGRTSSAFGLKSYAGAVLITGDNKLALVADDAERVHPSVSVLESRIRELLAAAGELTDAEVRKPTVRAELSESDIDAIEDEWKRRVAAQSPDGKGTISGKIEVTVGIEKTTSAGSIRLIPRFELMMSNNTAGHFLLYDRDRAQTIKAGADGVFQADGLVKGMYELTVSVPGRAKIKRNVVLGENDSQVTSDFLLTQGSTLSGVVLDESGNVVPGAEVRATKRHTNPQNPDAYTTGDLPKPVETDKLGVFELQSLHVGGFTIEITAGGYHKEVIPNIEGGTDDVLVVLRPLIKK